MKLVVLGLLLAVGGVTCEENQSRLKDHFLRSPVQHCTLQCEAQGGSGPSWVIKLDLRVYLVYNFEHQFFGLVNVQLSIAIIYRGGTLVLINTTTGASLVLEGDSVKYLGASIGFELGGAAAIYGSFEDAYLRNGTGSSFEFSLAVLLRYLEGHRNVTSAEFLGDFAGAIQGDFGIVLWEVGVGLSKGTVPPSGGAALFFGAIFESYTGSNDVYFAYFHFFYVAFAYNAKNTQLLADAIYNSTNTGDYGSLQALGAVFGTAGYLYANNNASAQAIQDQTLTYSIRRVKIEGRTYWFTFYRDRSAENWTIHILSGSSRLYIIYYKYLNVWIYFNPSTSYALVFPSAGHSYAFYNCTSGVGIVISKLLGKARLVLQDASHIAQLSSDGSYMSSFAAITSVVTKVDVGFFDGDAFFFPSFLSAIYSNGAEYQMNLNDGTKEQLDKNFGDLTVAFRGVAGYNPFHFSANVLLYFFHGMSLGELPKQLVVLAFAIATKASGLMNAFVMAHIFASIEFGVSFNFKGRIFADILGIGGATTNVTEAATS